MTLMDPANLETVRRLKPQGEEGQEFALAMLYLLLPLQLRLEGLRTGQPNHEIDQLAEAFTKELATLRDVLLDQKS